MFKELISTYYGFFKQSKRDSLVAIFAGIFGAITETIAIYYLSGIIRNLEYLKISKEIINEDISLTRELYIFLIFSVISSINFLYRTNI